MRHQFRQTLERYGHQIKDRKESAQQQDEGRLTQIDEAINYEIERSAKARANTPESQREVFEIQEVKQAIMQELHRRLSLIDKLGTSAFEPYKERAPHSRDVAMIDGTLRVLEAGQWKEITLGELVTDGEWNIDYILDERTVPRDVHKKYTIESAKRVLQHLLDQQIILDETASHRTDDYKKQAYQNLNTETLSVSPERRRSGALAEILFQNMLKKISIDTDANFEIIQADVYQDVHQKIDFIIRRKTHGRGVKVETVRESSSTHPQEHIGVQLTLQQDPTILRRKEQQVANAKKHMQDGSVDDIVLVTIQTVHLNQLVTAWVKQGRPAGGPDKLLSENTKHELLRSLLQGILPPEEVGNWK